MPKQKNYSSGAIYFTEKLQRQMDMLLDYPCTLLEAPMGYGKTTAVRESLKNIDAYVLWLKIYDNSITGFWSAFSRLFSELDMKCRDCLLQIGFPNDSTSREQVVRLIQSIPLSKETVVVLDDYHLIDSEDINNFIKFLVWNEIDNFHIVMTARFYCFSDLEEMALKGYLHHITKESFELCSKEIISYYSLCGINIKESDGDKLYKYTEGWISALYLLMLNYKEEDSFAAAVNITKLIEKAVYVHFSDEIKEFLLNISIFDSFTFEQADHIWQKENTEELLDEITSKNVFIHYDEKIKTYQIHKLFQEFLKDIFEGRKSEYKNILYKKAAVWYMKTGDYLAAMRYFYISKDFDSLLNALEADKGHSIHNEHRSVIIECFENCPEKIRENHPIALLIYALCLFSFNETELFTKVCGEFAAAIEENISLDAENINELMGEFELLLCFTGYNDIIKMLEHIKNAGTLLKHPAKFMDTNGGWTFGSPSVLYMFHREAGELQREVQNLKEAMPIYNGLTMGHGKGGEYVMEAEKYFNCGDMNSAEIIVHRALYLASKSEQADIITCAIFLQARIAVFKGDYTYAEHIFHMLHEEMESKKWYNLMHTIELCEAFIQACLQQGKAIPEWILDGDFDSSRLYFPAMAFLNIVYGRVLLIRGEYHKLLGIADQFIETASVFPNLLGHVYSYIYIAVANEKIYRHKDALSALKQALDVAIPDEIYMPFVENGDYIKSLLEELQYQSSYSGQIAGILELYISYQKSVQQINQGYFTQIKPKLTDREMEIAQLVAEGMSNNEIGKRLFISINTVKTLLKKVFEKLGINSRIMLKQYFEKEA